MILPKKSGRKPAGAGGMGVRRAAGFLIDFCPENFPKMQDDFIEDSPHLYSSVSLI